MPLQSALCEQDAHDEQQTLLAVLAELSPGSGKLFTTSIEQLTQQTELSTRAVTFGLVRFQQAGAIELKLASSRSGTCHIRLLTGGRNAELARPAESTPNEAPDSSSLATRIATDLDDLKHLDKYRKLFDHYPESALQDAWERTTRIPRHTIRKTPFHLFRWFLRTRHGSASSPSTSSNLCPPTNPTSSHPTPSSSALS